MSFAETLKRLRIKTGISRYRIWKFAGIDQSYLAKLENGDRVAPSRSTVILLGMAFLHNSDRVELSDIEELLLAADFAPLRKRDFAQEIKTRTSKKRARN